MDSQMAQTLIVALIVAGATLFMGMKVMRTINASRAKKRGDGCGGDCCS